MYFKSRDIYETKPDAVCYVPALAEDDEPGLTRNDFLDLCGGDQLKADIVFDLCTWEHPATILDQWDDEDEKELQELHAAE